MVKKSTVARKKKGTKAVSKKKVTKKAVARKKTAVKKTAVKKKAATKKKAITKKKSIAKKKAAPKKATVTKKKAKVIQLKPKSKTIKKAAAPKPVRQKTVVPKMADQQVEKVPDQTPVETIETNLPPVEEKSPEVEHIAIPLPGNDKKSMEQAAARHYDNHHIKLSNRKGGIKPSGKKPLW